MSEKCDHDERERTVGEVRNVAEVQESKSLSEDEPAELLKPAFGLKDPPISNDSCSDQVEDGVETSNSNPKRIKLSIDDKEVCVDSSENSSILGLTPKKTLSPILEHPRASQFPATELTIGRWKRVSKHKDDLVVRIYFTRRKLTWELIEGGSKSKIQMAWNDIGGIKGTIRDGEPGILEIEVVLTTIFANQLNNPPQFYRGAGRQKQTVWLLTSDITGGEALSYRMHHVIFSPGVLDEHFEMLMQSDLRLHGLSQMPFPSNNCLSFDQENPSPSRERSSGVQS